MPRQSRPRSAARTERALRNSTPITPRWGVALPPYARLVSRAKPAVVYVATTKTFATLKTPDDLVSLLSSADTDVRTRVEEYIHDHVTEFAQPQMF